MKLSKLLKSSEKYPLPNKVVSQLFEEYVINNKDKIAIETSTEAITYGELNIKSNILAHYLRKQGVGRNSVVGIYLERSIEFIISILAVVKAGGAYLPLDIEGTNARNGTILENNRPCKILTSAMLYDCLSNFVPNNLRNKIIKIDVIFYFQEKNVPTQNNLVTINSPSDLIYVMYTSGSTGIPKGCMIPHQAVVNLTKNKRFIKVKQSDCIAHLSNVAFDASTFEIWGALLNGAKIYIISRAILLSYMKLSMLLKENNISIIFVTTSLLNLIVKNQPDCFDSIRYLLFGGEKVNVEIIKMLLERKNYKKLCGLDIIHVYGPTENTTFSTFYRIKEDLINEKDIPIGKPIENVKTYILDKNLKTVSFGTIGELYIGGASLASSYFNNSIESSVKFINNPWDDEEKIYKTGDLVYQLPKRGLFFVGRIDDQVKVRGFRIEVAEVEAVIIKYSAVKQVTVLIEKKQPHVNSLIAYISFHTFNTNLLMDFWDYLKKHLPPYMLPAKILQIAQIPLTSNGKVDKRQLVNLPAIDIFLQGSIEKPKNMIEKIIAETWEDILQRPVISTTHNFFDLGADSLVVSEVCVLLNDKLAQYKEIDIIDIFNYPTVKSLANYIARENDYERGYLVHVIDRANQQRQLLLARNKFSYRHK